MKSYLKIIKAKEKKIPELEEIWVGNGKVIWLNLSNIF